MKKTVILNGPGTVLGARRDKLHRALDAAIDRKRAKDAKDGFRPRETPAPKKGYESFLDTVKRLKEKKEAKAGGKDVLTGRANAERVREITALLTYDKNIGVRALNLASRESNKQRYDAIRAKRAKLRNELLHLDKEAASEFAEDANPTKQGSVRHEVKPVGAIMAPIAKVIPRSKREVVDSDKRTAIIKKALGQGHQSATIAKFLGISKEEVLKVSKEQAKDSGSPFDRDTDAGAAKIVKREAAAGKTVAQIVKEYGFSKSFVEESMPAKGKANDAGMINVSYKLNGETVFQVNNAQFIEWARKNKKLTGNFADRLAALKEFTGDPRIKDWDMD